MEDLAKVILGIIVLVVIVFIWFINPKDNIVGKYGDYPVIEINGHHYIKRDGLYDHSMVHDPDCPKCKEEKSHE